MEYFNVAFFQSRIRYESTNTQKMVHKTGRTKTTKNAKLLAGLFSPYSCSNVLEPCFFACLSVLKLIKLIFTVFLCAIDAYRKRVFVTISHCLLQNNTLFGCCYCNIILYYEIMASCYLRLQNPTYRHA